jgi:hypothetical protein
MELLSLQIQENLLILALMSLFRFCDCYDYKTRDECHLGFPQMGYTNGIHDNGDDGCKYLAAPALGSGYKSIL